MTDPEFVATTTVPRPAITRLLLWVLTGAGAVLLVVGGVAWAVTDWSIAPAVAGTGACVGACGFLLLRWFSVSARSELRVGASGLAMTDAGVTQFWPWGEIQSVAVVGGVVRQLVVEDHRAVAAQQQRPRRDATVRAWGLGSPSAARFPLSRVEPDETTVVAAISRASNGRFPG